MIDLTKDGFTHEEIMEALEKKRSIKYKFAVVDRYGYTIGFMSNGNGSISHDSTREVMRTGNFVFKKSELLDLNTVDERIQPSMSVNIKDRWLDYPLGVFVIEKNENMDAGTVYVNATGYDLGMLIQGSKTDERYYLPQGVLYTGQAEQILQKSVIRTNVTTSTMALQTEKEYEIGTSDMKIINDLMGAINYNPLHFDNAGTAICDPYIFPEARATDMKYIADAKSVILNGISRGNNAFEIPNRFVRYTENVDGEYLKSVYVNDNPESIVSTINRGRIIYDIERVSDIASQGELDAYTKRIAIEKIQGIESVTFKSLNMPGHDYKNCIYLECEEMGIAGKYIEYGWTMELTPGGSMTHSCRKAVSL